jgi:NTF2-related export protein 1/2
VPPTTLPDGKTLPVLTFNGNIIPDPTALQTMFTTQMPTAHYEVQSYDAQVINPAYATAETQAAGVVGGVAPAGGDGRANISLLVLVSGYVRYGENVKEAAMRGFSESFVLVPNLALERTRGKGDGWLIQSQNFRLVV